MAWISGSWACAIVLESVSLLLRHRPHVSDASAHWAYYWVLGGHRGNTLKSAHHPVKWELCILGLSVTRCPCDSFKTCVLWQHEWFRFLVTCFSGAGPSVVLYLPRVNKAVTMLPFTGLSCCPALWATPPEAGFSCSQDSSADRFLSSLGRFMTGLDTKNNVKVRPSVPVASWWTIILKYFQPIMLTGIFMTEKSGLLILPRRPDTMVIKRIGFTSRRTKWTAVTLTKLPSLSKPQFPNLRNGDKSHVLKLWWGLNEFKIRGCRSSAWPYGQYCTYPGCC